MNISRRDFLKNAGSSLIFGALAIYFLYPTLKRKESRGCTLRVLTDHGTVVLIISTKNGEQRCEIDINEKVYSACKNLVLSGKYSSEADIEKAFSLLSDNDKLTSFNYYPINSPENDPDNKPTKTLYKSILLDQFSYTAKMLKTMAKELVQKGSFPTEESFLDTISERMQKNNSFRQGILRKRALGDQKALLF